MTPLDETLHFFSTQLGAPLPEGDFSEEGVELTIEDNPVSIYPAAHPDSLIMEVPLALLTSPEHFQELCRANYLSAQTGGCTLVLDEGGMLLSLKVVTTPGTSAQENWDWLHRLIGAAKHYVDTLTAWEEVTPLFELKEVTHD